MSDELVLALFLALVFVAGMGLSLPRLLRRRRRLDWRTLELAISTADNVAVRLMPQHPEQAYGASLVAESLRILRGAE